MESVLVLVWVRGRRWGAGAQGWWGGGWAHAVRRHSGLREQLKQRGGGEDRKVWGKPGMKRGREPLRLQEPPRYG